MHETQGRPADSWKIHSGEYRCRGSMHNIWVHPRAARYLPSSEDIDPEEDLADVGIFADIKRRPVMPIIKEQFRRHARRGNLRAAEVDAGDIVVRNFFRVASCFSGEKDTVQSDKNTTLKSRMAPSRTVPSQHSFTHRNRINHSPLSKSCRSVTPRVS